MKTSRNDPCPCGSGKKYKACCMARDEARAKARRLLGEDALAEMEARVGDAARQAPFWEADVVPLTGNFADTGTPGALAIVGAADFVLTGEVMGRRPVGAYDRAQAVLRAVMASGRSVGVLPERLRVRDDALADALRPELEPRGIQVQAAPLPELDEAVDASLENLAGSRAGGKAFTLWCWAETEAADEELAEFHAAAAEYHRAAPWRFLPDGEPLLLTFPGDDQPWSASAMGGAGIHFGLALYSDPGDVDALYASDVEDTDQNVGAMSGYSLSMSYDAAHDLPKLVRREVLSAGWEVARQNAYPTLMAICIPGRRITPDQVRRVGLACRTVTAFVQAQPEMLPWTAPTGVQVDLHNAPGDPDEIALPWPVLEHAHPVGPAGPNADPEASIQAWTGGVWEEFARAEIDRVERFTEWSRAQMPSRAAHEREVRAAVLWAEMLIRHRVPAQSATEYDLRIFLYDFLSGERYPKPVATYLTRSLRRLFRYYEEHEGVQYPWADGVLADLDALAADADDVRDVLNEVREVLAADILTRALRPAAEVPGTLTGWMIVVDETTAALRHELHRRWFAWYDDVVRGGITNTQDVRDVLLGRQRQWENTPHARHAGKTPKEILIESNEQRAEALSQLAQS